MKILSINPGSTSTKIAVYEDKREVFSKTLRHSAEELGKYSGIIAQFDFRRQMITDALEENNIDAREIKAIVGRGGLLRPIPSGTYEVNDLMKEDLSLCRYGEHASNLGGLLADAIAKEIPGCRAFIADPVVVDELQEVARISGHPLFKRLSIFHALNQKAIAKRYAEETGRPYESLNLIVVHLGGGTSVGAHRKGLIVDVNNCLNGEGPFSPERSGSLPAQQLAELCFSGKYTLEQVKKMINGKGGCVAHLGTNNFIDIENNLDKPEYKLICDAYLYNVAKEVGAKAAVLKGEVDAILITGGIAYGKGMMADLTDYIKFIAPVKLYPGEDEMGALAGNGLAVLTGKEQSKVY
ncbi:MAG: butyrate kinase [Bacteroidales bacterium]|nr:butyrate kinase [Candidatus Cacconaster caballi]